MNYPSGFPGTATVQNTAFIDQNCPSTWNAPPNMPPAWEPASYVNSTPYLSSTRSLSPMSGLFGSIWAPQSDVYESCCPVSATTQHSTHVENQAVMCKQEYYPRFNPFRAYMNLDIWTTAANRNANFPLSRDSGYCGNVWKEFDLKMWIKMLAILITRVSWLLNRLQCWWIFWHFYIENKFFYWSLSIQCILKSTAYSGCCYCQVKAIDLKFKFFFHERGQY